MRTLQLRFAVKTAAIAIIVIAGAVLIYYSLHRRAVAGYVVQARAALSEGDLKRAVPLFAKYLNANPTDTTARLEFADALIANAKPANKRRGLESAYFHLRRVLNEDPENESARTQLIRTAIGLERFDDARSELAALRVRNGENSQFFLLEAEALEAEGRFEQAADAYRRCIEQFPSDVTAYSRLAALLREHPVPGRAAEQFAEADRCIDAMLAVQPDSLTGQLAHFAYFSKYHGDDVSRLLKADDSLTQAEQSSPTDADVLLGRGVVAERNGDFATARNCFEKGLHLFPKDARFPRLRARLEAMLGNDEMATMELERGIGAFPAKDQPPLLFDLIDLLVDSGDLPRARLALARLEALHPPQASLDFLSGRLAMGEGDWPTAAERLERIAAMGDKLPELGPRIDTLLAQTYEMLGDDRGELSALHRLVARNPHAIAARLKLARAEHEAGQTDQAIDQLRQVVALPGSPSSAWTELVRLLIAREQKRQAPNWREVESTLERAASTLSGAELASLKSTLYLAKREVGKADDTLLNARLEFPDQIQVWTRSAELALLAHMPDRAREFLEMGRRLAGDSIELRLAWLKYWDAVRGPNETSAIAALTKHLDAFPSDERAPVMTEAAAVLTRHGELLVAESILDELTRQPGQENRMPIRRRLFELACERGADADIQMRLQDIERIENGNGRMWRLGNAERLIELARKGDANALLQAQELLVRLRAEAPHWPAVLSASGLADQIGGRTKEALVHYRQAVTLGERRRSVLTHVMQLLRSHQREREADEISKLMNGEPSSTPRSR